MKFIGVFLSVLAALLTAEVLRTPLNKGVKDLFQWLFEREREEYGRRKRAEGALNWGHSGEMSFWWRLRRRLGY